MGLLSMVFGERQPVLTRDRWPAFIEQVYSELAVGRPLFYEACVRLIQEMSASQVKRSVMEPEIELAILAYQLNLGRELIEQREYVSRQDGREFMTMFYRGPLGDRARLRREELMVRYWPTEKQPKILVFYDDIARHITGKDCPAIEALTLSAATIRPFTFIAKGAVAKAVGDEVTLRQLEKYAASEDV